MLVVLAPRLRSWDAIIFIFTSMSVSFATLLEITIVVLGFLYVILIALEKRIGWIVGVIGSALFVASNIQQHLYMDTILNSYYVVVGIYGWFLWGGENKAAEIPVTKIKPSLLIALLGLSALLILAFGTVLEHYTSNSLPYLDAGVTILSFLATWMSTKKYIENWLLWLVADPLAMILYAMKGGWFYPILFGAYTIMAIYGYFKWKKHLANAV
ncbi:MAG: rane protein [Bacteroidetes bacterium]|nr:rane protein [Bacteroidota bacterium]